MRRALVQHCACINQDDGRRVRQHRAGGPPRLADRVLLPTRRLHDGGDRCPLGLSEQGEDGLLLGPAAGRTQGDVRRLRSPAWSRRGSNPRRCSKASQVCSRGSWGAKTWSLWGFCRATFEDPFRLRRHQAPPPPKPRSGTIASGAGGVRLTRCRQRIMRHVVLHAGQAGLVNQTLGSFVE
jgi:hypothetical protein